jgi:hypothetical protein
MPSTTDATTCTAPITIKQGCTAVPLRGWHKTGKSKISNLLAAVSEETQKQKYYEFEKRTPQTPKVLGVTFGRFIFVDVRSAEDGSTQNLAMRQSTEQKYSQRLHSKVLINRSQMVTLSHGSHGLHGKLDSTLPGMMSWLSASLSHDFSIKYACDLTINW